MTPNNFRVKNGLTVSNGIVVEAGVISGNGSSITSVNAATLNGNTAAQLRAYTDSSIGTSNTAIVANASAAYTNAVSYTDTKIGTANSAITGNAATAYTNAVSYTDTKIGTANTAMAANAAAAYTNAVSYTDGKILTANSAITGNAATAYTNATTYASNASNLSTGTVAEARLPYRMNQNVRTTDSVEFADITLTGNLVVSGTRTYVNTTTLDVGDNIITLNADLGAATPTENAGIEIMRGTSANVQFIWDETNDRWTTNGQPLAISSLITSTNTATFGTAAYIVANGNIGAGTAAPSNQFSVGGNSLATISFDWTGDNAAKAWISANYSSGEVRYAAVTNYFPAFYSNNNERMRIDLSGSVLINRTSESGLGKLNCEGGADFTGGNVYLGRDTGNVAIGTTTATSKLYIKSAGSNIIAAELSSNANTIFKVYESAGDGYLEVLSGASSPVSKLSGYTGTPTYFLSNTGIGNTAPTDKLSVNGTTYLQGVTTLAANLVMANNNITRPVLTGYTEAEVANTAATGTWTMDCAAANFFDLTLTGSITISPTNVPPSTRVWSGTIAAKQDATGGRTITWPTGTKWPGGVAPPATTTANAIDIWSVMTYDGGTTWIASLSVKNAS